MGWSSKNPSDLSTTNLSPAQNSTPTWRWSSADLGTREKFLTSWGGRGSRFNVDDATVAPWMKKNWKQNPEKQMSHVKLRAVITINEYIIILEYVFSCGWWNVDRFSFNVRVIGKESKKVAWILLIIAPTQTVSNMVRANYSTLPTNTHC